MGCSREITVNDFVLYIAISLLLDITGSEMGRLMKRIEWLKRQRDKSKVMKKSMGRQSTEFKRFLALRQGSSLHGQGFLRVIFVSLA